MTDTKETNNEQKFITHHPGVYCAQGLDISKEAAGLFAPLVGRTIKSVQLQASSDSWHPDIVLIFDDASYAFILADAEGNGPGFIEHNKADK